MSKLNNPAETLRQLRSRIGHMEDPEIRQEFLKVLGDTKLGYNYKPFISENPLIYRATKLKDERGFSDDDGNPFIDRLHCPAPPADRKYKFGRGRCNMENESMFYGASENGVPIFEVQAEKGDYVVVSSWANKKATPISNNRPSLPINVFGIALGVGQIIKSDIDADLKNHLRSTEPYFDPSNPQIVKDVDGFIGQVFVEKGSEEVYKFTGNLSNIIFNNFRHNTGKPIDAFIYPSVESKASGHNIVFNAEFARSTFMLWEANMYFVDEHHKQESKFGLLHVKSLVLDWNTGIYKWIDATNPNKKLWLSPSTPKVPYE